jgi:hypothetical protein
LAPPANKKSAASRIFSSQKPIGLSRATRLWAVVAGLWLILRAPRLQSFLECAIFHAGGAAAFLDFHKLEPSQIELALADISLAEIFARVDIVGIDVQGPLVKRDAEVDVAELALAIAEICQDSWIVLIRRQREDLDGVALMAVQSQRPTCSRQVIV